MMEIAWFQIFLQKRKLVFFEKNGHKIKYIESNSYESIIGIMTKKEKGEWKSIKCYKRSIQRFFARIKSKKQIIEMEQLKRN